MSSIPFINLHAHTTFSMADGLNYPKDHFDFVIENAEDASMSMAITDHGNANSFGYAFQAQNDLHKKGIQFKFIPGCEFYYHPNLENWKKIYDAKKQGTVEELDDGLVIEIENESKGKYYDPIKRRHHLVVFAYNRVGLKNLYRLISRSYRRGFYRYPRIDNRMLEDCKEGLVISTACLAGLGSWLSLRDEDLDENEMNKVFDEELKPLLEIFGPQHANLEIQFNSLPEQRIVNDALIKYASHSGFPLLATADSHYCRPEYWRERELYRMLGWQTKGMTVSSADLPENIDDLKCELYPKNGDQMFAAYKKMYGADANSKLDDLVKNSITRGWDIGNDLCEFINQDTSMKLPKSKNKGKTDYEILSKSCYEALRARGFEDKKEYADRLRLELSVIKKKNFSKYFTTLDMAMKEIKKHMLSSPGRGSGAGSLVLYLLDITQVDPIKNGLLFERFLSEHREEPPDVDLDSQDRDACIKILRSLFGETEVVPITNYNTLQLKSLVKDISKLYEIPFEEVNAVTRVMEEEARQPILDEIGGDQKLYKFNYKNAMKHSSTLRGFIEKYPHVGDHIDILYKQIKSIGRHAGGVAITDCAEEAMPVIRVRGEDQTPWTEGLTAKHLEPAGVIKYDFLGLATLRYIEKCIYLLLKKKLKREPKFDEINDFYKENLHPDVVGDGNIRVFEEVYQKGKFPGIFQFTERNAQKFCEASKPETVMDLAAITSIYRPGPLAGNVDKKWVEAVHNPESVTYDHSILFEVLGDTNGYIVYQEQFMLLANKLAGFTLEESNKLRKLLVRPVQSMGDELKKQRIEVAEKFIKGCVEKGLSRERAEKLWHEEILGFISYGFNKSHALTYAYVSYQCAWLFHNYPDEWVAAYLENDPDRDKAIYDVESVGYKVGKSDIIKSTADWSVEDKVLIPSFSTLKGIGDVAVDELIQKREGWKIPDSKAEGREYFKDIFDSFFFEWYEVEQKKGKKLKRKWKFSKFNKRAIEALMKIEGMDSLGIVGDGRLFENYAHMYRTLMEFWNKKDTQKFNILELADQIPDKKDWAPEEKIDFQAEIIGTYDKELIFSSQDIENIESCGFVPLSFLNESSQSHWFILEDFEIRFTSKKPKKEYFRLYISDIIGNRRVLNYWFKPKEPFKKKSVYVADLQMNGSWINVSKGSYLLRVKK